MQTLQFPMTLTHRDNPHAQVVVANAEQLAQMPEEYLPAIIGAAPAILTAAAAIPGVNLDAGTSTAVDTTEQAERRQSLDEAVDEFTAHVQAETTKIDAAHAQLATDRAALHQQAAALNDQVEALARERAEFEAQKNLAQIPAADATAPPADAGTPAVADPDAATPPAAPAKRTRAGTKEGA